MANDLSPHGQLAVKRMEEALSSEKVARIFLEREQLHHGRSFDGNTVARLTQLILRARHDGASFA